MISLITVIEHKNVIRNLTLLLECDITTIKLDLLTIK